MWRRILRLSWLSTYVQYHASVSTKWFISSFWLIFLWVICDINQIQIHISFMWFCSLFSTDHFPDIKSFIHVHCILKCYSLLSFFWTFFFYQSILTAVPMWLIWYDWDHNKTKFDPWCWKTYDQFQNFSLHMWCWGQYEYSMWSRYRLMSMLS